MAYKCKSCGRYVKRDATVCKHCGEVNPAIEEEVKAEPVSAAYVKCQCCNTKNYYRSELDGEKLITCGKCGAHIVNPYYNKYAIIGQHKTLIIVTLAIVIIMVIGAIGGSKDSHNQNDVVIANNNTSSVPKMTDEWKEAAANEDFEYGGEVSLSDEVLYRLESSYGRSFDSVFEKYMNKSIGKQAILLEEPLRTLLVETVGIDGLAFMMKCRKTDLGLEKEVTDIVKYTYDCYLDTPNGNYFALAFMNDGKTKAFFLEMKKKGTMFNVSISQFN